MKIRPFQDSRYTKKKFKKKKHSKNKKQQRNKEQFILRFIHFRLALAWLSLWLPGSLAPWLPGSLAPSLAPWLHGSMVSRKLDSKFNQFQVLAPERLIIKQLTSYTPARDSTHYQLWWQCFLRRVHGCCSATYSTIAVGEFEWTDGYGNSCAQVEMGTGLGLTVCEVPMTIDQALDLFFETVVVNLTQVRLGHVMLASECVFRKQMS